MNITSCVVRFAVTLGILGFLMMLPASAGLYAAEDDSSDNYDPARDGPDPGLAVFALTAIVLILILVGIGIVVGTAVVMIAAGLVAAGILSSSTLMGVLTRRPSVAAQVLFLQLGALCGIAAGIGLLALGNYLFAWGLEFGWIALVGGGTGLGAGLIVALLFNLAWTRLLAWGVERFRAWKDRRAKKPTASPQP